MLDKRHSQIQHHSLNLNEYRTLLPTEEFFSQITNTIMVKHVPKAREGSTACSRLHTTQHLSTKTKT